MNDRTGFGAVPRQGGCRRRKSLAGTELSRELDSLRLFSVPVLPNTEMQDTGTARVIHHSRTDPRERAECIEEYSSGPFVVLLLLRRSPITRHGDTFGYYIPPRRKRSEAERAALKEAAVRLQEVLAAEGISEEEILNDFKRWRAGGRK